jgi:hypothetical protein
MFKRVSDFPTVTQWGRIILEKPTVAQMLKKFTALPGTRRFTTVYTKARHLIGWYKRRILLGILPYRG